MNTTRAAYCPSITRWCLTKPTKSKTSSGQYSAWRWSNYRIADLRRDIGVVSRMRKFGTEELDRVLERLDFINGRFFGLFGEAERRIAFQGRDAFRDEHEETYSDLLAALDLTASYLKLLKDPPDEIIPLFRRATELREALRFVMEEEDERFVYWIEKRGRGTFLQATPIEVSEIVGERLFNRVETVVLTSATLAVAGGFEFTQKRLGLSNPRTLIVPGHFDYQKQALLYVPQHLPYPNSPAFTKMAAEEMGAHSGAQPGARLRAVHQLSADAHGARSRVARDRLSHAAAGYGAAQRTARGVPRHAELRVVRDLRASGREWMFQANS